MLSCPFVMINIKIKEWVGDFQIEEKKYESVKLSWHHGGDMLLL